MRASVCIAFLALLMAACSGTPTDEGANQAVELPILWQRAATWPWLRTPAVVDSACYLTLQWGILAELNLRDGALRREAHPPEASAYESPMISDGTLYITCPNSNASAFSLNDMSLRWSTYVVPPDSFDCCGMHIAWFVSAPSIDASRVFFNSQDGNAYCLDRLTGHVNWKYALGATCVATPLVHHDAVYVAGFDSMLTVLNPATGAASWQVHLNGAVEYTAPEALGDLLYIADRQGYVYCLDVRTRAFRWVRQAGTEVRADISVTEDAVCVASNSGLFALNPLTGELLWTKNEFGNGPVQNDGFVFFLTRAGHFLMIDTTTGHTQAQAHVGAGTLFAKPVVLPDRVLVPARGALYCLGRPKSRSGRLD